MYPAIRSSMVANAPDISDARTMFTYRGPNSFGYLTIAPENCFPLSMSILIEKRIFLNFGFVTWSAMPSRAARRLMPARIMTASWVVKSRTSFCEGPLE